MENMDIQIIKSRRRTVSIEVHTDGSVILRAPNRMTKKELDIFIDKHMSWIESKQQLMKERKEEKINQIQESSSKSQTCLLYTSDAADEL